MLQGAVAGGLGGFAGGTVSALASGANLGEALSAGLKGGAMGLAMGATTRSAQAWDDGIDPLTNKPLNAPAMSSSYFDQQAIDDIRSMLSKDQAKHTGGDPTRSQIYPHEDSAELIYEGMGKGQPMSPDKQRGDLGFKERVDYNREVGVYHSDPKTIGPVYKAPTTRLMIIYGKDGIHIVPVRPKSR